MRKVLLVLALWLLDGLLIVGCSSGSKTEQECIPESQSYVACYPQQGPGADVYYFDSCDQVETMASNCPDEHSKCVLNESQLPVCECTNHWQGDNCDVCPPEWTGENCDLVMPGLVRWSFGTGVEFESSPAIGMDGTIYVGANNKKLYAFDGETGAIKWTFATNGKVDSSPALKSDGTIYVGSEDRNLYSLDKEGNFKWSYTTKPGMNDVDGLTSPAIGSDGTIYFGSLDKNVYAIDPDGNLKWSYLTGWMVVASPVIGSDGTVYIGAYDDIFYAFDGQTGSVKWSYQTGDMIRSSAAIASDNSIYVGSWDGFVYAFDGANGNLKWSFETSVDTSPNSPCMPDAKGTGSSPAIGSNGVVYIASDDTHVYALDGATGALNWSYHTGRCLTASVAIGSDQTVYVGSLETNMYVEQNKDAMFYALSAQDGSLKWSYETKQRVGSSPAIGTNGLVYFGTVDHRGDLSTGGFYALTSQSVGLLDSDWPKFRGNAQNTGRKH